MQDLAEEKQRKLLSWLFAFAPSRAGLTARLGEKFGK